MRPYTDPACNRKWYIALADRPGRGPEVLRNAQGRVVEFDSEAECQAYIDGQIIPVEVEVKEIDDEPKRKRRAA